MKARHPLIGKEKRKKPLFGRIELILMILLALFILAVLIAGEIVF